METQTIPRKVDFEPNGTLVKEFDASRAEKLETLKVQISSCSSDIKVSKPNLPLENFVGLKEIKRDILNYLEKSGAAKALYGNPDFGHNDRILLFGASGNGKAHLIKAIATELNANLIELMGPTILSKWASNMELYTEALLQTRKEEVPLTILFLRYLDDLCFREKDKQAFIRFIGTVQKAWNDKVKLPSRLVIMATTYEPNDLDENIVPKFDRRIYIPTLNLNERREQFERMIQKQWWLGHVMAPEDIERLARKTYGILTSEIEKTVKRATHIQYPQVGPFINFSLDDITWRPLELGDFEKVVGESIMLSSKSFFEFETFQRKFGNGPFMRMYERDDYDEDAPRKSEKKKSSWVWTAFSWL